ncbi:MAG: hypothetical protein CMG00_00605 [Candidatus Marinimicrobia bacterium]|nr:hypothetical protein [Candidatus Neomarinimicrobiota bacterium]|tara:strand:+ start:1296 stop:1679 length:384 start_codon:yes stop_codon:yes gene_type:complete
MSEISIIKEKKNNIYSSFFSDNYAYKFLFKSILHHVISLEVYENSKNNGISFETICSNIPKSIGSRSSIQSILNEALENNIFFKYQSKKDKRIKNYFLGDDFLFMINNWLKKEQSYFKNINGNGELK